MENERLMTGVEIPHLTVSRTRQAQGVARRRAPLLSAARLALLRLGRAKGLLALLTLGMLLASAISCTVPLYDILISNIQLQRTLSQDEPSARNIDTSLTLTTPANVSPLDRQVRDFAGNDLREFTTSAPFFYAISDPVIVAQAGSRTFNLTHSDTQVTLDTMDYALAAPHMRFIAGQAPADGTSHDALITKQMADAYQLKLGDTITTVEFGRHENELASRVVGIWEPRDKDDPFWNGFSFAADNYSSALIYPIMLAKDAAQLGFGYGAPKGFITGLHLTAHWIYYTDPHKITTKNMGDIANAVAHFRSHIKQNMQTNGPAIAATNVATALDGSLDDVARQSALLGLPLYMVAVSLIGLALVFVATIAAMLIEAQAGEVATLKSRGLGGGQALGVFALQGLLPFALALAVGPIVGALAAFALVRATLPPDALAQTGITPLYLAGVARPGDALLPAGVAALLGYAALVLAASRAARRDVLAFRREAGRQQHPPLWRRLYLDVVLAGVCALGYLDLAQFGSTDTRLSLGNLANSPLLFLTPALLLLAGALLMLRLLPLVAHQGVRRASGFRGLIALLAFTSIARAPSRHARVALLLTLAVGLGVFALAYDATLTQNANDRASYQAGADFRLTVSSGVGAQELPLLQSEIADLPDVAGTTSVYRGQALGAAADGTDAPLDLLGVDPSSFGVVAGDSWRADYADVPLSTLLRRLTVKASDQLVGAPIIISDSMAQQLQRRVGDLVRLQFPALNYAVASFRVVGIVHAFPTLYPAARPLGFAITALDDMTALSRAAPEKPEKEVQADEFWVKARADSDAQQRLATTLRARRGQLGLTEIADRQQVLATIDSNPLNAGMRGLLLSGSVIAGALAILTIMVQSALSARARTAQFAVLRTLGLARGQLARLLLGEFALVCALGIVGGTALGLLLTTVTLPFLQFGDITLDPAILGVPPYRITLSPLVLAIFYVVLVAALAFATLLSTRYAYRLGLGRTLRVGED